MKSKRLIGFCVLLLAATANAAAWSAGPRVRTGSNVDTDSVLRMGDTVQHVNGFQAGDEAASDFAEAMGVPADDNHKWFVSVIGSTGCKPCARLKEEWKTDKYLLALANPDDTANSWSHFNWYLWGDRAQDWRWRNLTIKFVPTIIVQPPRNWSRGDPSTVVFQGVWDGNNEKLVRDVAAAVKRYLAKLRSDNPAPPGPPVGAKGDGFGQQLAERFDWNIAPPWSPNPVPPTTPQTPPLAPSVTPSNDADGLQIPPPTIPPTATPTPTPGPKPPEEPTPTNPNDAPPEAVIVTDVGDEVFADGRIGRIVGLLQTRLGPGAKLRTRIMDWRDVDARYPVRRDELPAVVLSQNGRIVDKVSARLLPLLESREVTIADVPWSAVVSLVTTGFSIPAALALVVWLLRFIRSKRVADGKETILNQETFDAATAALHQLLQRAATKSPPANSSANGGPAS